MYASSFDSTYEGLKLEVDVLRWHHHPGFDSTYEGLKPLGDAEHVPDEPVSTVPMRA